MIPVENLVAACTSSTSTKLCVAVSAPEQVPGVAWALQLGADALLLAPDTALWESAQVALAQRMELVDPSISNEEAVVAASTGAWTYCAAIHYIVYMPE
jgi:3-dehydroquinate synthase class II